MSGVFRAFAIGFLMVIASSSLFADDITAYGNGRTEAEAIRDADAMLAQHIAINTSSVTNIIQSDDGNNAVDYMSINAISSYDIDFLGAELETERLDDGSWTARKTIPESSLGLYIEKVEKSAEIINSLYGKVEESDTISFSDYSRLLSQIKDYETNRIIIHLLDSSASISPVRTNSTDIEAYYQGTLEKERNAAETTVKSLELQRNLGILTAEGEKALSEAAVSLENKRREQQALRQAQEAEADRKRENFTSQQIELLLDFELPEIENSDSASSMINEIEAIRSAFTDYVNVLRTTISDFDVRCDNEIRSLQKEVSGMEYYGFELDADGNPTESAVRMRNDYIGERQSAIIEDYKNEVNKAYNEGVSHLLPVVKMAASAISSLNSESFVISSGNSALSTDIIGFDVNSFEWIGKTVFTIGNSSVELEYRIPFSAWTGVQVDKENYYSVRDVIQDWTDIFVLYPYVYTLEIEYSVKAYPDSPDYLISLDHYNIIRNDNNRIVYSESSTLTAVIEYADNCSFLNLQIESSLIDSGNVNYPSDSLDEMHDMLWDFSLAKENEDIARKQKRAEERLNFTFPDYSVDMGIGMAFGPASGFILDYGMRFFFDKFSIGYMMGIKTNNFLAGDSGAGLPLALTLDYYIPFNSKSALELSADIGFSMYLGEFDYDFISFYGKLQAGYFLWVSPGVSLTFSAACILMQGQAMGGIYMSLGLYL